MGVTGFISVCLFVAAVLVVAWGAFWLINRFPLTPRGKNIATAAVILIGLAVLAYHFAGGVLPK